MKETVYELEKLRMLHDLLPAFNTKLLNAFELIIWQHFCAALDH